MSGEEFAYVRAEMLHAGEHIAQKEWLDAGMTPDEVIVFSLAVTLWNAICDLPDIDELAGDEYLEAIHMIQNKIAARPFFRAATSVESDT